MGNSVPASHNLYQMSSPHRSLGGTAANLLPEEIEFARECFRNRRSAAFVAELLECSTRSISRHFSIFREAGVPLHPINIEDLDDAATE